MTAATAIAEKRTRTNPEYTISGSNALDRIKIETHAACQMIDALGLRYAEWSVPMDLKNSPSAAMAKYTRGPAMIIALAEARMESAIIPATTCVAAGPNNASDAF